MALSRRVTARVRSLRGLVRETQKALEEQADVISDPEISSRVQEIGELSARSTALVVLGNTAPARARLLHCLLGQPLLPDPVPQGCRWIRIQYGSTTQVHLTLSNSEFELVEELECNKQPWETLPVEDLTRHDDFYPSTMLEIELNIPYLKDGLKIIVPPDIIDSETQNFLNLKQIHSEFYEKRESILKNYNTVYLYAIDEIGKSVFSDNIGGMASSRNEEEFWSKFSLYDTGGSVEKREEEVREEREWKESGEPAVLGGANCLDLHQIKEIDSNAQLYFFLFSDSTEEKRGDEKRVQSEATESGEIYEELPEADQGLVKGLRHTETRLYEQQTAFMNELLDQWDLMFTPPPKHLVKSQYAIIDEEEIRRNQHSFDKEETTLRSKSALINSVLKFTAESVKTFLLHCCTKLSEIHVKLVQQLILASFDMARELQVVPKKIHYVATQEQQLYTTINEKFSEGESKRQMIRLMQEVLAEMKSEVNNMDWSVDDLPWHQDHRSVASSAVFERGTTRPRHDFDTTDVEAAECCDSYNFEDYDIIDDDSLSASYARVKSPGAEPAGCASHCTVSVKCASLDVQRTVLSKLSRKVSLKLVNFVDCLKDSYFGTLQRCLESLETSCRSELGGRPASEAMRLLLSVARQVDLQPQASFSTMRSFMDSIRRLLNRLRLVGDETESSCCVLSPAWRRQVASQTINSLSATRLCRIISAQILERLSEAHERYQSALTSLQAALANRLHHTEDVKLTIRKHYAPCFARLCLESTSMCDLLIYRTPELGREIGRGQYGVVYSVRGGWAQHSPVCVKSVLPADDRHYRELAMEFFYTRSIPWHPRIVRLFGCIVQRGGSAAPRVLLVSRRYCRDLHAAVRAGVPFRTRMAISADIVEGIRYLHSLGLVHRDIKMKNVLLDEDDRAALSDLGFCAAEALISGSVVGTPVHMAPELLAGEYDANVDIYAFGILFWYVCAGNIKLPSAFEAFQNKEQLWSKVKRGLRPERLPHFPDACWSIMESCWASEPHQRALLGDIQIQLTRLLEDTLHSDLDQNSTDNQ